MLTDEQRATFERDGILRLPAAFSAGDAVRMQDVLWAEMRDRYGIERDDRSTWPAGAVVGMKTSKRSKVFAPICGPVVSAALDELFDPSGWRRPDQYGNVLVTFPDTDEWRVPHRIWHADHDDACSGSRLLAVKVWSLCDDVPPGAGGTPLLAGRRRVVEVTGAAGDVVITHGWVYHSIAANAGSAPRLMRGTNVYARNENVF